MSDTSSFYTKGVMNMPQPVNFGRKTRMSFSKINEVAEMPNLIQIQTESYDWFIREGIREVFDDISPIKDYAGNSLIIHSPMLRNTSRRNVRKEM